MVKMLMRQYLSLMEIIFSQTEMLQVLKQNIQRGGKTIISNGNAQIDTTIKKFGTGSLMLDGTGDYIAVANDPDFGFGTGTFSTPKDGSYANNVSGTKAMIHMRAGTNTDPWIICSSGK